MKKETEQVFDWEIAKITGEVDKRNYYDCDIKEIEDATISSTGFMNSKFLGNIKHTNFKNTPIIDCDLSITEFIENHFENVTITNCNTTGTKFIKCTGTILFADCTEIPLDQETDDFLVLESE
ncbi:MAG: hypothetical protein A2086_17275 [Spirochaetes bacterium GWD1_27_9]|nr:MAG: hypothetical protein A2Z98_12440 [Spirochaetes bacterium GWB1_27_13]OHD42473.1 MAG: hypothetical protein A2086_17275 [Spirochaetes bacterium GWD1_27_9]